VSGNVRGVWSQAGNPYIVTGNLTVLDSLVIKPGTIVRFDAGGWSLHAGTNARLVARGTKDSMVTFEALTIQNPGAWDAIVLENSGSDDTLDYCFIRSAADGIRVLSGGGTVNTTITNCTILNNSLSGIRVESGGARDGGGESTMATIARCQISRNNGNGVTVYAHGAAVDSVNIQQCTIESNGSSGVVTDVVWYWVWNNPLAVAVVSQCSIVNNTRDGVTSTHETDSGISRVIMRNDIVADNRRYGLANPTGGNTSASDISYNCLWGNTSGPFQSVTKTGFGANGAYRNANGDSCDVNFNIYYDPFLADTAARNFSLLPVSRAIDAGSSIVAGKYVSDPDSTTPDIGAFYFPHRIGIYLFYPANHEVVISDSIRFLWYRCIPVVQRYRLDLSTDSLFTSLIVDSAITDTGKTLKGLGQGIWWWRVRAKSNAGWGAYSAPRAFQRMTATSVADNSTLPATSFLLQNYPNPFNPTTTIRYALSSRSHVTLDLFNTLGQIVRELVNGDLEAGRHEVRVDASGLASGVYFYRLRAGNFIQTKSLSLLR
jgi:hypothetical protein